MISNILILGGNSFIGKNLIKAFDNKSFNLHIVQRHNNNTISEANNYYFFSYFKVENIIKVIEDNNINCVIDLISTIIPSSNLEQYDYEIRNNYTTKLSLLKYFADFNIKYVYISSGGTIYGQNNEILQNEESILAPINYYGLSKLIFEETIKIYNINHNLQYLIIRPSNPYGSYQDKNKLQGFVSVAINNILHNNIIEIWGNGNIVRDYIYISDLINAIINLLEINVSNQIFNIGSGKGTTLLQVIKEIEVITNKKAVLDFKNQRIIDIPINILDISKLKKYIYFDPMTLNSGLKLYINTLTTL
jgi:UDP-glucose 4-epimerase